MLLVTNEDNVSRWPVIAVPARQVCAISLCLCATKAREGPDEPLSSVSEMDSVESQHKEINMKSNENVRTVAVCRWAKNRFLLNTLSNPTNVASRNTIPSPQLLPKK